jgi:hypothetical protein
MSGDVATRSRLGRARVAAADRDWRGVVAGLFPEVGPPSLDLAVMLGGVAALVAGTALVLARQTGPGALDTLYAEDGQIFLTAARQMPFWSGLWEPYAGYGHLVPRFLAELVAPLPLDRAAEAMAVTAAAGAAVLALVAFRALAGHIESGVIRGVAAASVLAVPAGQEEVFAVVANLHWLLVPVAALVLLWNPRASYEIGIAFVIVFLAAASDPMAVVLLPLALARAVASLPGRAKLPVAALGVGLLVQAVVVAGGSETRDFSEPIRNPAKLLVWFVFDVPGRTVGGTRWVDGISDPLSWLVVGLALAALAALIVLCWRTIPVRDLAAPLALVVTGGLLYLAYAGISGERPPRYGVPSGILLIAAAAIVVDRLRTRLAPHRARRLVLLAAVGVTVVWVANLRIDTGRTDGPTWSTEVEHARDRCETGGPETVRIPIAPDPSWTIEVDCVDLDGAS